MRSMRTRHIWPPETIRCFTKKHESEDGDLKTLPPAGVLALGKWVALQTTQNNGTWMRLTAYRPIEPSHKSDWGWYMLKKIFVWLDKRYVISRRAQMAAVNAQQTGQSFDELYEQAKWEHWIMFDWLNKQKYLTISVVISLIFGVSILAVALFSGLTTVDAAYTAGGLALLSLIGFGLAALIMPKKQSDWGWYMRKRQVWREVSRVAQFPGPRGGNYWDLSWNIAWLQDTGPRP